MHIGMDGRSLCTPLRGIGIYTHALARHLPLVAPHHTYTLFVDKPPLVEVPAAWKIRTLPAWSRNWWEMVTLPEALRRYRVDLYHGTDHFQIPMHHVCPTVITVHDLAAWLFPETVSWKFHWLFKTRLRRAATVADQIIAISQSTANDLHRLLPASLSKTSVIHLGVNTFQHPALRRSPRRSWRDPFKIRDPHAAILETHHISKPYLLSVCALEPRKNIETLIRAFQVLQSQPEFAHFQLALVGQPWRQAHHLYRLAASNPRIVFTGHVSEEALAQLYRHAELFVYPSWYEGFGLPPLEAMACGTPVITSNTSCFPEVLGNAAHFVNEPKNPAAWASAITTLLSDPKRLEALRARGSNRVKQFSWTRMAQETLKVYESATELRVKS